MDRHDRRRTRDDDHDMSRESKRRRDDFGPVERSRHADAHSRDLHDARSQQDDRFQGSREHDRQSGRFAAQQGTDQRGSAGDGWQDRNAAPGRGFGSDRGGFGRGGAPMRGRGRGPPGEGGRGFAWQGGGRSSGGDWGPNRSADAGIHGGRGADSGQFPPRGGGRMGGRFGGREAGGGRFDGAPGRGGPAFRGRGLPGRGGMFAPPGSDMGLGKGAALEPQPFSRGQPVPGAEGSMGPPAAPGAPQPPPPVGSNPRAGAPGGPRRPFVDPTLLERRKNSEANRLKHVAQQLQVSEGMVPPRLYERLQAIANSSTTGSTGPVRSVPHISTAYMHPLVADDQPWTTALLALNMPAFEKSLQLLAQASQADLVQPSQHGHFLLTPLQASVLNTRT